MIEKKIDYRRVLDFLEHKNSKIPDNLELLIKEVIKEIIEIGQVKFCHLTVDRNLVPDEQSIFKIYMRQILSILRRLCVPAIRTFHWNGISG